MGWDVGRSYSSRTASSPYALLADMVAAAKSDQDDSIQIVAENIHIEPNGTIHIGTIGVRRDPYHSGDRRMIQGYR